MTERFGKSFHPRSQQWHSGLKLWDHQGSDIGFVPTIKLSVDVTSLCEVQRFFDAPRVHIKCEM